MAPPPFTQHAIVVATGKTRAQGQRPVARLHIHPQGHGGSRDHEVHRRHWRMGASERHGSHQGDIVARRQAIDTAGLARHLGGHDSDRCRSLGQALNDHLVVGHGAGIAPGQHPLQHLAELFQLVAQQIRHGRPARGQAGDLRAGHGLADGVGPEQRGVLPQGQIHPAVQAERPVRDPKLNAVDAQRRDIELDGLAGAVAPARQVDAACQGAGIAALAKDDIGQALGLVFAGDTAQIEIFDQGVATVFLDPLRHDDGGEIGLLETDRIDEGAHYLVDLVAAGRLRQQLEIPDELMGPQLVTRRAIVGTGNNAVLAAHIGRLARTCHVHGLQYLGSGFAQVKLHVDGVTGLGATAGDGHTLVAKVRGLDKLVEPDLIIRHLEPGTVIVEDHQGGVRAPLPLAVSGIPHLLPELLHLDIRQPGGELLGVELARDPQPGDALANHVRAPIGAVGQHEGIAGLTIGVQLVADQLPEGADQVVTKPDIPDTVELVASQYQGDMQPLPLVLFARLLSGETHQARRDHPAIGASLVAGGSPQDLAALAGAAIVPQAGFLGGDHHGGAGHRRPDGDGRGGSDHQGRPRASGDTSNDRNGNSGHYSTLQAIRGTASGMGRAPCSVMAHTCPAHITAAVWPWGPSNTRASPRWAMATGTRSNSVSRAAAMLPWVLANTRLAPISVR
ncbi:hypothetical protein D3C79_415070 [compost metagenome]